MSALNAAIAVAKPLTTRIGMCRVNGMPYACVRARSTTESTAVASTIAVSWTPLMVISPAAVDAGPAVWMAAC
jgi:hypothetical protein